MSLSCRAVAASVFAATLGKGQSLSETLPAALEKVSERDRPLLQQLCYGGLRNYHRLDAILGQLLRKPLKAKDSDIVALLLLGIYQLEDMRIPPHAAISATVEAARELNKPWATGLVNGVLRRYTRETEALLQTLDAEQSASHPSWLYRALEQAWPEQLQDILRANNDQPPMCLRCNRRQGSRDDYLDALQQQEIAAIPCQHSEDGLRLERASDVKLLPGFADGRVSVQDEAAQLAAGLLDARPGHKVLDACAAPGGKACHILELQPEIETLVAMDSDNRRLERVEENLERLGLAATVICGDATAPPQDLKRDAFDRILVDAPCSGTGVIRRHPDIKLLRRESDLDKLARTQFAILQCLWPLLKPGGKLLYATCSILHQENSEIVARFLSQESDASEVSLEVEWGLQQEHGRQILPCCDGPDGLYYALLRKAG